MTIIEWIKSRIKSNTGHQLTSGINRPKKQTNKIENAVARDTLT